MNDQFLMWTQMTFADLFSVTGSPASAAGPAPCASPGGQTTGPCGPEARRANLSAPQGRASAETTRDTSAPILSDWSGLPAPQCCLASKSQVRQFSDQLQAAVNEKLAERLNGRGSTIYSFVSKLHVTPHGREIFRLRASGRRISDSEPSLEQSDLTGLNTPRATDGSNGGPNQAGGALPADAAMSGWPTPNAANGDRAAFSDFNKLMERRAAGRQQNLQEVCIVAGWPTPPTRDHKDGPECLNVPVNALLGREVWKAGWPTPMAGTPAQNGNNAAGNNDSSRKTVDLVTVPGPMRLTARGELLTGSSAGMESGGQLSPAMSAYLMGYPMTWCEAAISAFKAKPKRRRAK